MIGWLLLASILGSAYFAASEIAVVSSDRLRHRAERESGRRLSGLAERLYRRPAQTLVVLLLGNNFVNITASICALLITETALHRLGLHLPAIWSDLISSLWISCVVLVFGEILAKAIGYAYALRLARLTAPILIGITTLLRPLFWIGDGFVRLFLRKREKSDSRVSWETVRLHLEAGMAEGILAPEEDLLIRRIARLNRLTAEQLMTPLAELALYPESGDREGLRALLLARGARDCFLYRGSRGRVVGIVQARRLLDPDRSQTPARISLPLRQVPAHRPLLDLIDELQLTDSKRAVVTGLSGEARGVIFLDRLLRQLVLIQSPVEMEGEAAN